MKTTCWSLLQWLEWAEWCRGLHRWHRVRPPASRPRCGARYRRSPCWSWWWWPSTRSGAACRTLCPARPSPGRSRARRISTFPCWQSYWVAAAPCGCSSVSSPGSSGQWCVATTWISSGSSKFWIFAQPWRYIPVSIARTVGWGLKKRRMGGFQGGRLYWGKRE